MVRGKGIKRTETVSDGYPCVRYGEIYTSYNTSFDKTISFIPESLYNICNHFGYGDIVFTLTGENKQDIAKAITYIGNDSVAAGGDMAYWTNHQLNPFYITYYLSSPYAIDLKRETATGDIIVHISTSKVGLFLIPVPPLNEQERIVKRIAELEPYIKNYNQLYEKINSINTSINGQLKKSILQYAIEGKLVKQNPNDEPASELIRRIRAEKEKLIQSGKLKKDKNESYIYRGSDNSYYEKFQNGKEVCIDDEIPFEIPQSWGWCRLSGICNIVNGFTPLRSNSEFWSNGDIPWFTVDDIHTQGRRIRYTKQKISQKALSKNSNRILPAHTVLICCTASVGEYAIAEIPLTTNQQFNGLIINEFWNKHYDAEFLFTLSQTFKDRLISVAGKTTFNFISVKKLGAFLIPVPPLNE